MNLPEREIHVDLRQLAEIIEERGRLGYLNPDLTENTAEFMGWATRRFHLELGYKYKLVLDYP